MTAPRDWLVLELNSRGEGEDPDVIRRSIRGVVRQAEVFVPASVTEMGGDKVVRYLIEGYAFIRTDPDRSPSVYKRLEGTKYVQSILVDAVRKSFATISDAEVEAMRERILAEADQGIRVGDEVMILSGPYKDIMASVIEDISEEGQVQVYVRLRSKQAVLTLPRASLKVLRRASGSFFKERAGNIRRWIGYSRVLVSWAPVVERFTRKAGLWGFLHGSVETIRSILGLLEAPDPPDAPDLDSITRQALRWRMLDRVTGDVRGRLEQIDRLEEVLETPLPSLDRVRDTYRRFLIIESYEGRLDRLHRDVLDLGAKK